MRRPSANSPPMDAGCRPKAASARPRSFSSPSALGEYLRADLRRHPDEPGRDRAAAGARPDGPQIAARRTDAVETLIADGNTPAQRARLVALIREPRARPRSATPGLDETLEAIRAEMRKFAESEVHAARPRVAPEERVHSARGHREARRTRRLRPDPPGGIRRHGARQGLDVRRVGGAVARLYRRRLARHALGDRGGADPRRRHGRAEGALAAAHRLRRGAADRGLHRAQHRLRPRLAEDPRRARRATSTRSPATRRGSPIRSAPT